MLQAAAASPVSDLCRTALAVLPGTSSALESKLGGGYSWSPSNHPSFFPGRQSTITARGQQVRCWKPQIL